MLSRISKFINLCYDQVANYFVKSTVTEGLTDVGRLGERGVRYLGCYLDQNSMVWL